MAGQVIETVGAEFANTTFAYQREQKGTANAVKTVFESMPNINPDSVMLLTAGDRIIEQSVLEKLFDLYYTQNCDLAMLTLPRRDSSSQGRVVTDASGSPLAIIEMADIAQRIIYKAMRDFLLQHDLPDRKKLIDLIEIVFFGKDEVKTEKLQKAFGPLWELLSDENAEISTEKLLKLIPEEKTYFEFVNSDGSIERKTPEEVEAASYFNTSVYLVKKSMLEFALKNLGSENAQKEEYLSDIIAILAKRGSKMKILNISDRSKIQGFNNPAELLEIENNIRATDKSKKNADYFVGKTIPSGSKLA